MLIFVSHRFLVHVKSIVNDETAERPIKSPHQHPAIQLRSKRGASWLRQFPEEAGRWAEANLGGSSTYPVYLFVSVRVCQVFLNPAKNMWNAALNEELAPITDQSYGFGSIFKCEGQPAPTPSVKVEHQQLDQLVRHPFLQPYSRKSKAPWEESNWCQVLASKRSMSKKLLIVPEGCHWATAPNFCLCFPSTLVSLCVKEIQNITATEQQIDKERRSADGFIEFIGMKFQRIVSFLAL